MKLELPAETSTWRTLVLNDGVQPPSGVGVGEPELSGGGVGVAVDVVVAVTEAFGVDVADGTPATC